MKYLRLIPLLFVLGASSLSAHLHPNPGGFQVTGEFLYLKPTFDDTYFVLVAPTASEVSAEGTRENNDFGYKPGFRVGASYGFCDCERELQVYYTRLGATQNETIAGDNLFIVIGNGEFDDISPYTGTASSSLDVLYQRVDGLFAQQSYNCCGLDMYVLAGLEYDYARLQENISYNSIAAVPHTVSRHTKTWGIGPQLGLDLDYSLRRFSCICPGNLSLAFRTSGSLLASKNEEHFTTISDGINVDVEDENTWRIVPALHLRAGLNYTACFSCFAAALEVGYEFNSYIRSLSRMDFPFDNSGLSTTNYYNYDLQGLYVSGSVSF